MGIGLRPGAKAPDQPPNPTGYAPPLDSTHAAGRRPRHEAGAQGGREAEACDDGGTAQGGRRADAELLGLAASGQGAGGNAEEVTQRALAGSGVGGPSLTEQQLAVLRSEPGSNRVARAMALTGVTQVNLAKALGLTQPYLRQRCRPRALPDDYGGERKEVRLLLRLPYRGSVPVTPPNVGMNEDGPLKGPAARQSGISRRRSGPAGQTARNPLDPPSTDLSQTNQMGSAPRAGRDAGGPPLASAQ